MAGQVLADTEALRSLQTGLSQFSHGANDAMSQVASELFAARERIETRTGYWQAELRRREAALRDCMSSDSEDCRRERMVVDEAMEALQTLRRLASALEQVSGEYNSQQSRFKQAIDTDIGKGKADLERSIRKYEEYSQITIRPHAQNKVERRVLKEPDGITSQEKPKKPAEPPEGYNPGGPER
jgi:hypothetical protein